MTKKDYQAIGTALRRTAASFKAGFTKDVIRLTAENIAYVLEVDNPKFDRARFLRFVETGKDTKSPEDGEV